MIPRNWLECPWYSEESILDLFIASKTFLNSSYRKAIPEGFRYEPSHLIEMEKRFKKKIGVVIDLNNSRKYYQPEDVEALGKKYYKIACSGHDAAPTKQQVSAFIDICKRHEESSPDNLILVHCTHGFNRTCYMIASYLIEERMMDLRTSLDYLSEARSPGIYKQDYVEELRKIYQYDEPIICAQKPQWNAKNILQTYSQSNGDKRITLTTNDKPSSHNPPKAAYEDNGKFCFDGLNISLAIEEDALAIKSRMQELFPAFRNTFPGSQPVSMDSNNVQFILQNAYSISWKADGTRYLMYISEKNKVFMIDRDFNIFKVPSLVFPLSPNQQTCDRDSIQTILHTHDTLVDGEMIVEIVNNLMYPRFMIYDLILLNGLHCGNENFWKRYHHIRVDLIDPRDFYIQNGTYPRQSQTFSVRRKQFYELKFSKYLFKEVMPNITHPTDGIVFQPVNVPYTPGVCASILKWKPPHLNTIDFRLMISTVKMPGCLIEKRAHLYLSGSDQSIAEIRYSNSMKDLHNKIVECNLINGGWNIIRIREDKSFANSVSTAKAVMDSIVNPVTEKDLYKMLCIE